MLKVIVTKLGLFEQTLVKFVNNSVIKLFFLIKCIKMYHTIYNNKIDTCHF